MSVNPLDFPWLVICLVGIVVSLLCLQDATDVRGWQRANGINGLRRMLVNIHVRTAYLRTVELLAALSIGVVAFFPGRLASVIAVVGLFVIVLCISYASLADLRDRRKIAEYPE